MGTQAVIAGAAAGAPRVSVIIPTRDRLPRLRRAIESVARQSYRDFEVIVVDDGSTDGTVDWLEEAASEAGAGPVRAIVAGAPGGRGAAAARNRGVAAARGELIAFLDDDDAWRPAYLDAQLQCLDANRATALSFADHVEVWSDGTATRPDTRPIVTYSTALERMLAEAFIHTMSVVVCRRDLFDRHGGFDERLSIVQDWEWYARLLTAGEQFAHVERTLVGRAVPGGLVTQHRAWFVEERGVLVAAGGTRRVRASRSLFFARLSLSRGDVPFGLLRLVEALSIAPGVTCEVAARRIARRIERRIGAADRAEPWDAPVSVSP